MSATQSLFWCLGVKLRSTKSCGRHPLVLGPAARLPPSVQHPLMPACRISLATRFLAIQRKHF